MTFSDLYAMFVIIFSGLIPVIFFNSTFDRKHRLNYIIMVSIVLNIIQAFVYLLKIPTLNLIVYVACNITLVLTMYESSKNASVLYTLILCSIMMLSEFFVATIMHRFLKINISMLLKGKNIIIYSVLCKSMYLILVLIAKKFILKHRTGYSYDNTYFFFISVPIATMILLSALYFIVNRLQETESIILLVAVLPLVMSEFVCYIVYDYIIDKSRSINLFRENVHKNELQLKQYALYKQRYESSRIILHDVKQHLEIIKNLSGQPEKVEKYIANYLKSANDRFIYSNNEVLNIILNEKADECKQKGIRFSASVSTNKVNKIFDNDLVAIFCNLLDNAIESCMLCTDKTIILDVYEVNAAFLAINMSNSCEHELKFRNEHLISTKTDSENHGFGMSSISKSVSKYQGDIDYIYDKDKKMFSITILMNFEDIV